jgi:hypothetical protein
MLSDEVYDGLKAAKKKANHSLTLSCAGSQKKGNPAAIKAVFEELGSDPELANSINRANRDLRKGFKTRKVEL